MHAKNNILLAFLPWIIFSAGITTFLNSAIIAFILTLVISRKDLLRGVVLEIGGALFFAAMIVLAVLFPHGNTFTQHPNLWSNVAMVVIMLGSVAINKPFTAQYTDQGTLKFHRQLSAIWGFLLLLATIFSLAHIYFGLSNTVSTIGTVVAILIGIKANTWYPKWYIKNIVTVSNKKREKMTMQKITFIGLGKLGTAMATKLLQAGFQMTVYNRTREKALPLEKLGAIIADSLESAVCDADIVITSVIDDNALISVTENILPHLKAGAIHVSTSTILPKTANLLSKLYQEKNCIYVASPVLGIPHAVMASKATSICAGDKNAVEKIKPLLESFSLRVIELGDQVAHANVLKICLNYTLISAIELISELYAFAEKSGLDTTVVQETLHHVYAHPAVKIYIDKIHARDFDNVNFAMRGGNKDIHLFQEAFMDVGVIPDIANMLRGKFTQALATGMENKDWSAVCEVIRNRSGLN